MNPENELGPQIALYRARPFGRRDLLRMIVPGALSVLAPLAYGLYRADYAYSHYGPTLAAQWGRPWFFISLILLVFFALAATLRIRQLRRFVAVHRDGLLIALSRRSALCWEQISGVSIDISQEHFLGFPLRKFYGVTIYPSVGKSISLGGSLPGLPELATQIKAHLYPHLLPKLEANFQSGQWLHFGPVSIHSSLLQFRNLQIPWTQVTSVDIRSGHLIVESEGHPRLRIATSTIPNLELLIQIIHSGVYA